jgi:hypothetical protein
MLSNSGSLRLPLFYYEIKNFEKTPFPGFDVMSASSTRSVTLDQSPLNKGVNSMIDSSIPTVQPAIEQLDDQPSLLMGLVAGVIAMLLGAVVWGAITYFTEYQIGWIAIGVGFLVGVAIRFFGRGKTMVFGIAGAVLALLGCLLGNLFFYSGVIAREEAVSFLEVFFFFLLTPAAALEVFMVAFDVMDILFYGLAAYAGFSAAMDIKRHKK